MNSGRRAGVCAGLGIAMGSLSWALLSVAGVSALVAAYAPLLLAIKMMGGLYLLYLAWRAFKAARLDDDFDIGKKDAQRRSNFKQACSGYLVMMTNPKAILGWIAIVSLGMEEGAPWWVAALLIAGTFTISVVAHVAYAILFSTPRMVRAYRNSKRFVQAAFGTFFTIAGLRLLTSE